MPDPTTRALRAAEALCLLCISEETEREDLRDLAPATLHVIKEAMEARGIRLEDN